MLYQVNEAIYYQLTIEWLPSQSSTEYLDVYIFTSYQQQQQQQQ